MQLPEGPYDVILADPPWRFQVWSEQTGSLKSPGRYYATMTPESILRLPVGALAARDAALFLWAVAPNLPLALNVMSTWGFTYKTVAFTWAKTTRLRQRWHFGLGYYTRANAEFCLLGTRGKPLRRAARNVRSLLVASVREHSRKPDDQYERIEQLFGPSTRRLELFARPPHPTGWDVWGLEAKNQEEHSDATSEIEHPSV